MRAPQARPFGAGAPRRPHGGSSPFTSMTCLMVSVCAMAVVWYVVTVAILSGCDGSTLSADGAVAGGAPGAQPARTGLLRIGAIAMSKFRTTLDRMKASDAVVDEGAFVAHAARRPGGAKAGGASSKADDSLREGGGSDDAAAAAAAPAPRALKPATMTDPKVAALTKRLLRVLAAERAAAGAGEPGSPSADFDGLAAALAAAVVKAEASGVAVTAVDDEPVARGSPKPRGKAAEPGDVPPEEYTQQTCYLQTDESEICVYDGVLCYDGRSPVVAVDKPVRTPERILDYTHYCSDFRYYEPSAMEYSGCAYKHPFERNYKFELPMSPATDFPLPLGRRRWGPQNRNGHLYFREVTPEEIWGPPSEGTHLPDRRSEGTPGADGPVTGPFALSPSGRYASTLVTDEPFPFDGNLSSALRIARRTRVGNRTIDWVDGHLWLAGIDGQFWQNPYHWWSKIGVLYDALRSNATPGFLDHPADGWLQHRSAGEITSQPGSISRKAVTQNRMTFKQGAQWDLPPMDYVLFTGDGAVVLDGVRKLNPWFKGTLDLATQPHTKHFFNEVLSQLDDWHYLCTRRGGIPGVKNKIFTGRADAWLWRHYAYKALGLGAKGYRSHPRYPPRKVTIIDRKGLNGRGIYNKEALIGAVAATGLPYQVVPNMASLSFAEQVELLAGTGILIAPHGAHLTNAMFLPVHSVVIELFPYLLKKNTYKHLASLADLHYFPVYSWELLPPSLNTTFYGVALMQEKYYWDNCVKVNISSYEALMEHACNAMSKNYPIVVPFPQFTMVMKDAVDSIGAFSLQNPEWAAVAENEGQPVPSPPASAQQPDKFGIYG